MENLVRIFDKPQYFSLEEASSLLPLVSRITARSSREVQALIDRLDVLGAECEELVHELELEINEIIRSWHMKIERLGAVPKGLWVVDFDCGNGYYCWKYPEQELLYWHAYDEGFAQRTQFQGIEIENLLIEENGR